MNCRGLFCFLIVLAFIAMRLAFLQGSIDARQGLAGARALAIEGEQLNLARTALEISVDNVVEGALEQGLRENLGPEEIKGLVNGRVMRLFGRAKEEYNGEVKVRFWAKGGVLGKGFLDENSKVSVVNVKGKAIAAEYVFTGGLLKSKGVRAEIAGERAMQEFRIPVGYTARAMVVV